MTPLTGEANRQLGKQVQGLVQEMIQEWEYLLLALNLNNLVNAELFQQYMGRILIMAGISTTAVLKRVLPIVCGYCLKSNVSLSLSHDALLLLGSLLELVTPRVVQGHFGQVFENLCRVYIKTKNQCDIALNEAELKQLEKIQQLVREQMIFLRFVCQEKYEAMASGLSDMKELTPLLSIS